MMKIYEKDILYCGNIDTFAMKIKLLDTKIPEFQDCVYTFVFEGQEYGIDNTEMLESHDFIECNILRNDIESALEIFDNEKNIFDLTNISKKISIEEAIKQIIRYHYCRGMEDELEMNYSHAINDFVQQVSQEESDVITFIMNGHDSMQDYFFIPFFIDDIFYIGIAKKNNDYDNFDCSDDYDWSLDMFTYKKIDRKDFIKVLECTKNVLDETSKKVRN